MSLQINCPHCHGQRFAHIERALVHYEVKAFGRDDRGRLIGAEFTGTPQPNWESVEQVELPWFCLNCKEEMDEDELLVDGAKAKDELVEKARVALDTEMRRLFGESLDGEQIEALNDANQCFEMIDDMESRMGLYVTDARTFLIDAHAPGAAVDATT